MNETAELTILLSVSVRVENDLVIVSPTFGAVSAVAVDDSGGHEEKNEP
jgi:hypothetical protein